MTTPIDLIQESEKFPQIEKVRVADKAPWDILQPDLNIDKIRAQEVSNRWNAYKRREIKPIPYDEVISRYKKL